MGSKRVLGLLMYILTIPFLFMLTVSTNVYAREDVDAISYIAENQPTLARICSIANQEVGVEIISYTAGDGMLSFSNKKYSQLDSVDRSDFMETALKGIAESGLNSKVKNKAYNFIADQDSELTATVKYLKNNSSADFATASAWFKPFASGFGIFFGIVSLVIFLSLSITFVFDWGYIVIPPVRLLGKDGGKPWFVSNEAYESVKKVESGETSRGVASVYLGKRVPLIILMSISLGYLISGQIYDILVYFINAFTITV